VIKLFLYRFELFMLFINLFLKLHRCIDGGLNISRHNGESSFSLHSGTFGSFHQIDVTVKMHDFITA